MYVKKLGDLVLLIPKRAAWNAFVASLDHFTEDFMSERTQPPGQKRERL